jgi:hypothetical protein
MRLSRCSASSKAWFGRAVILCGSSGFVQDLACVSRVLRADHDVVRPHGAQPVSSPGPAVRYPGQALDAGATQDRAEQLGLGLATGDLDYDPVVHLGYPNVHAKLTSTTRLRSSAGPSGSELSHSVAPSSVGMCTRSNTVT